MLVALLDRVEWGEPEVIAGTRTIARQDGVCFDCGGDIGVGDDIVLARVGPSDQNRQSYIHVVCPDLWELLALTVERYDDKIITKVNPVGRGRAAGCGHDVEGRPVYLVRLPVSLRDPNHSYWYCEACVTPRTVS